MSFSSGNYRKFSDTSIHLDKKIFPIYRKIFGVSLMANLDASDEQLISDFKSWLKVARTSFDSRAPEEVFAQKDFKSWYKYAILPYFDLAIWALLNRAEFAVPIMIEAIFPNAESKGFVPESRLIRETKPRSAELFDSNNINAMIAQLRNIEHLQKR
jgi:hypothetical protein